MGCKAAETTRNISNTFGPGTANERTVQWWVRRFCQGDKNLEDEECSGQPLEVDGDQLSGSSQLILLPPHKKLPKSSVSTILQSFGIWSKLERWKSSINGCLMSCLPQKIIVLKRCLLLFYATTRNHFSTGLLYARKSGFYQDNLRWSARLLDREEAPKHVPKPKCTKKRSWSLVVCCWPNPL